MPIDDSSDPWLGQTSNVWPIEEHHYAESFALSASGKTTTLPFGATSFHSPLALTPSEKTGGFDSTAMKTTTPSRTLEILLFMPVAL